MKIDEIYRPSETRSGHTWDLADRGENAMQVKTLLRDFASEANSAEPAKLEALAKILDDAYGEYLVTEWWNK